MLPLLPPMPQNSTSPNNAGETLGEFIYWFRDFLVDLSQDTMLMTESTGFLFDQEQIALFPSALNEAIQDGHFTRVHQLITQADEQTIQSISDHGLYGAQLQWKLSNINFSFHRFLNRHTAALFSRLLTSIDTLLDSILGAVPGGSAIKELKDAVLDSVALVTE